MKKRNKKALFGIFSVLDIILIFCIIIVIFLCFIFMGGGEQKTNQIIVFTMKISEIEKEIIDELNIGDILYDVKTNSEIGEILEFDSTRTYIYLYDYKNKYYKKNEIEDKYNLNIKIKSKVHETDNDFIVSNLNIKANNYITLKVQGYYLYGKIISIER